MNIRISEHFDDSKLLRFTLPSIAMMIFSSIYGVVDGYFVSNFVGKTAFSAVNFIMPVLMILATLGFMIGTGGSALVAKTKGEGDAKRANEIFSLLIYFAIGCGVLLSAAAYFFLPRLAYFLGAEGQLLADSICYGRILVLVLPVFLLQFAFQSFFVTAEKPQLGLAVTLAAGLTNMVLDALFIAVFRWGIVGAAAATALSQSIGGIVPLVYFLRPNSSTLRLSRTRFEGKALLKACTNGASELMSNIAMSLVSILYNVQLLKYIGEDGISAYGVLMYVGMIFSAVFMGYAVGCAPIVSYHYGAANFGELKSLLRKSIRITLNASVLMLLASELLAEPLSRCFVGYDETLLIITLNAFRIYSFGYCFMGIAIFGSSFFTALNNGLLSAVISFLRTLVFQVAAILLLPLIWGVDGLWLSTVVAELMAAALTVIFIVAMRRRYRYG